MKKEKLHSIAPILSHIKKKKNNFKTPNGYFNTIDDVVITKLKAATTQHKDQDQIPKDYFDSIEDTVIAKIQHLKNTKKSKNTVFKYSIPIAIAASILLIFNIFNKTEALTFDSIATAEIDAWISNNLNEIPPDQIATIYSDIELDYEDFSTQLTDEEVFDYIQKEGLENILIEE
ncbi:hypothetical protein ACFQZW_09830 [Lutibacter aestuarii]|uniref:Uncharacterized protein n=1 Tax=Lutibacter aestuarii TaxID=861111 RepID=A0ABW2Z8S3_9FLAO|nr:hypothetical protein [uncultured Lutibacter sp.]